MSRLFTLDLWAIDPWNWVDKHLCSPYDKHILFSISQEYILVIGYTELPCYCINYMLSQTNGLWVTTLHCPGVFNGKPIDQICMSDICIGFLSQMHSKNKQHPMHFCLFTMITSRLGSGKLHLFWVKRLTCIQWWCIYRSWLVKEGIYFCPNMNMEMVGERYSASDWDVGNLLWMVDWWFLAAVWLNCANHQSTSGSIAAHTRWVVRSAGRMIAVITRGRTI